MKSQNSNSQRLERIARYGEWICLGSILLVGGYCTFLALQPQEAVAVLQRGIPGQNYPPSDTMLILAGLIGLLPILLFLFTLWQARKLFGLIGAGRFLSEASQRLMMHLGGLAIALALLGIVARAIVVILMTSANPPGQRMFILEIGSGEISSVIIAVLFFTFALLMREMATIAEENKSFI